MNLNRERSIINKTPNKLFTLTHNFLKMLQLVVFDMAGTTVHDESNVAKCLQSAFEEKNIIINLKDALDVMGIPKPIAIGQLLSSSVKDPLIINDHLIEEIHFSFVSKMINHYETNESVRERTGVSDIFLFLKEKNIKIAIDTGFDRQITDVILKRLKWIENKLIDASVASDEVEYGRPYPDMIFKAMELTGVNDVKNVAKVGDTASDMQQGTAAKCAWVIGVTTGAYSKEDLEKFPHTHLIERVSELNKIFNL